MPIIFDILLVLTYVLSPLGILYLCFKYKKLNKIGAVLLAYVVGILLSTTGILQGERVEFIQEIIMSVCIPIGIPLLLFSSDLRQSFFLARSAMVSLLVALFSVVTVVVVGYLLFQPNEADSFYKVGGLLVGIYTGGTPNLAALQMVLDVDAETYLMVHTYDMLFSTLHLFFLMTIGKKVFEFFLPTFKKKTNQEFDENSSANEELFWGLLKRDNQSAIFKALGIAVLMVVVGGGLMMLVSEKSKMAVLVLSITSLGVLASFNNKIKSLPKTFELGMYFILVFSVVVSSKLNLSELSHINVSVFYYILFVVFGSLLLHVLICMIFKVDADTVIITSAALICSPPFVPVVAGALNNRSIIISGITIGVVGYAIGNYLGYLMSELLQLL
ncbi:DUF819 family protein [Labilibacter marinus]|uniref:DUF819 family protein n=1 Tax=Labilibacter marinus TaxID=1477105 RepID=UPI00094FBEF9|nr:DUF819 family protein [Labilibacter marinus]